MNNLFKKTASVLIAATMAATGLGTAAFAEGRIESVTVEYNATVAKPTFSIKGDAGYRKIKISTKTSGATIYYTTDGSSPITNGKKYKSGTLIKLTAGKTIRAVAIKGKSKSAVASKIVDVETLYGDVTCHGDITESDYTRLKNYINGKTSYICIDNSDVNADGKITKADLNLIRDYLDGEIDVFPADEIEAVDTPAVRTYEVNGGVRVTAETDDGSKIYYTTNGSTPTTSSKRYTKAITVTEGTTFKFVAYSNGRYSGVVTKKVDISKCSDVTADMSDSKTYNDSVTVRLSCRTGSSDIIYTTDGTNPKTSSSARRYSGPITLSADTVVKAYATAYGHNDGNVSTYNYKVNSTSFTISGSVWDDKSRDGYRSTSENGINNIKVYLYDMNTGRNTYSTTTKTINGKAGAYEFTGLTNGHKYKVVFEYNGQQYRSISSYLNGGNQAVATSSSNLPMTVMYSGAYTSNGVKITSINNYSQAVNSSVFTTTAESYYTYSSSAANVDCALVSDVYGSLNLGLRSTSSYREVNPGDYVTYDLSLYNRSASALSDATITFYASDYLSDVEFYYNGREIYTRKTSSGYELTDFIGRGLSGGNTATISVTAQVSSNAPGGASISNSAEVSSYTYSNACYDKDSVPGNMGSRIGTARENDEAVSNTITVAKQKASDEVDVETTEIYIDIERYTGKVLDWGKNVMCTESGTPKFNAYIYNGTGIEAGSVLMVDNRQANHCYGEATAMAVMGKSDQVNYYITVNPYGYFDTAHVADDVITVYSSSNPNARKTIRIHYIIVDNDEDEWWDGPGYLY